MVFQRLDKREFQAYNIVGRSKEPRSRPQCNNEGEPLYKQANVYQDKTY